MEGVSQELYDVKDSSKGKPFPISIFMTGLTRLCLFTISSMRPLCFQNKKYIKNA